jgi:hypothetical protein
MDEFRWKSDKDKYKKRIERRQEAEKRLRKRYPRKPITRAEIIELMRNREGRP